MTICIQAELAIDAHDRIGEGPMWDSSAKRFLWSDNEAGVLHEARSNGEGGWRETRRWDLGLPIGAAVPRAGGGLIVVAGVEAYTLDENGSLTAFVRLEADADVVRVNDAKCDSNGRLWVGTLSRDFSRGRGALYRVDPDGTTTTMLKNVTISNGMDWSPDGLTFYYIDSPTRRVDAFDFDKERGTICNRRAVVTTRSGDGAPDGLTVDREGCLWVAIFPSGEVRRYSPEGELLARIQISAPAVTSCAFGGDDLGLLFITSAATRLPELFVDFGFDPKVVRNAHLAAGAGGLFICRPPGVTGRPATAFAG